MIDEHLAIQNEQKTVLIVDDTELNVDILVELLEDKYDILASLDGQGAIELAQEEDIDLILLDIMMPELDGYEVCKILKENPKTKDIPVVFITAKTDEDSIKQAYDVGGVDYITKPFRTQEVLARISTHLKLSTQSNILNKLVDSKAKLVDDLLAIGISLTSESDFGILMEKIMLGAKNFTNSDAGTLYLVSDDKKLLEFWIVQTDSLDIKMGGDGEKLTWPPLPLYDENNQPNEHLVAVTCALEKQLYNFEDVYDVEGFNFDGTKVFDETTNYRTQSMLVVPMVDRDNKTIGVLQLINKKNYLGETVPFTKQDEIIITSMGSLGAVSIHNHKLVKNLEELLESFIDTIVDTLEEKSAYTEHHVVRVATITDMLSKAISNDDTMFKDTTFDSDELKELHMSAMLHDIGKIITPEHVVDKATRLETIYDRINAINLKFNILIYLEYIQYLENKISQDEYEKRKQQIKEDQKFINECNTIGFLSDDMLQRIKDIGSTIINIDGEDQTLFSEDELYNLSIRKGTLTNEERDIINNHVTVSYNMLKNLPFPDEFKNIPQIAGSHHKFVDGQGGYGAKELMGIPLNLKEKILAIADVFEALTSPERPYKKANTLSESFKIMSFMVKDGHLDRDIVRFMIDKKLYLDFAKEYLNEEQIDDVKIEV